MAVARRLQALAAGMAFKKPWMDWLKAQGYKRDTADSLVNREFYRKDALTDQIIKTLATELAKYKFTAGDVSNGYWRFHLGQLRVYVKARNKDKGPGHTLLMNF
jgi:hypothetical protein